MILNPQYTTTEDKVKTDVVSEPAGLSTVHISPNVHCDGVARVVMTTNGDICRVEIPTPRVAPDTKGQTRDEITGFSRSARKRMMAFVAKTDDRVRPVFVTLTYPDEFDHDPTAWKRDIDAFGKRLLRSYPESSMFWRIETIDRKSGTNEGRVAPHYHALIWGVGYDELMEWLPGAWNGVVARGNNDHLAAGTRIEQMRKRRGTMFYCAKYMSKEDDGSPLLGRHWGVIGRANVPLSAVVVCYVSRETAVRMTRIGRKYIGLSGKTLKYGLTWFINGSDVARAVAMIGGVDETITMDGQTALHKNVWKSR